MSPTDVEEGMRVGVDRTKYSVQIPLPPKIDPTVRSGDREREKKKKDKEEREEAREKRPRRPQSLVTATVITAPATATVDGIYFTVALCSSVLSLHRLAARVTRAYGTVGWLGGR